MITYSTVYEYEEQLKDFIDYNKIEDSKKVLLQIFTATVEESYIQRLLNIIKKYLPNINIIGTSTAGEIVKNVSSSDSTVLTFSIFKDTIIETNILENKGDSFELAYDLLSSIDNLSDVKLAISFADGLNNNGEEYLKGFSAFKDDLIISGGLAGDNYTFKKTLVFNDKKIISSGAVIALFHNSNLNIFTNYNFNWQSIGKKHIIEKSYKNRVFRIEGKTAKEFYSYYLGKKVAELLPTIGSEFPLIMKINDIDVARVVMSNNEDGSLIFGGNVPEGSEVRLGFGNVQMILDDAKSNISSLNNQCIESIFIYSCAARKLLLKDNIDVELKPFSKVCDVNGCFLYGEFYSSDNTNHFLNESMTILGISESDKKISINDNNQEILINEKTLFDFYRIQGLSKLITQTTNELESLNENLEKRVEEEVTKSIAKDAILESSARNAQMGEMIDMIVHQWRQPLNAFSTGISSLKFQAENGMLSDDTLIKSSTTLLENVNFLNDTIEDFRNYFKSSDKKELIRPQKLIVKTNILYKSLLVKHSIILNENYSYNEFISVPIGKMMQVILNIVKNSVDAIVEKDIKNAEINISTFKEKDYCILEIEDNAKGIPDDIISKVFDKRFTTKDDKDGTGLGLHMSKSIMNVHLNGELEVRNSAKGAVFILKIPLL